MRMCKQPGRPRRPVNTLVGFAAALFLTFGPVRGAGAMDAAPISVASASVLPLLLGGLFGSSSSSSSSPAEAPRPPAPVTDLSPAAATPRPEQAVINPLEALSPYVPGPGEWRQVPGLQFERFGLADQEANALNIRGTAGSAAVLSSQTGSAYDPESFLWYFWGGGASAYGGNEVYRLDLTLPLVTQLTQPSILSSTVTVPNASNCFAPLDGPAAGATFDGFVWSPATQSFFVFPTGGYCPTGTYNQETIWEFDPLAGTWDPVAAMTGLDGPAFAEYDPVSGLIYVVEAGVNATLRDFDPVTGQLGARVSLGTKLTVGNAVLDRRTDEMIVFAQEGVFAISLTNPGTIGLLASVPNGFDTASGAALDTQSGVVALWAGGKTVRSFDIATGEWTDEIASSGPTAGPGGVFSKWISIEELGIFAGYHNPAEGLWLYRLPTALSTPPPANTAPVAFAGVSQVAARTGNVVNLDGSGSFDPDGDALTYAWSTVSSPAGAPPTLTTPNQAATSFTPAVNGGYVLRLTVSDGTLSDTVTVTVTAGNAVPVADAGADQSVQVGRTASLNASGSSDADGDTLSYSWSLATAPTGSGAALSGAQSVSPSFVADIAGTYLLSVTVSDGIASAIDTVDVSATAAPPANSAPVANAGPNQTLTVGQTATLTGLQSSDPDGNSLNYTWTLTKPSGSTASLSNATAAQPTLTLDVAGTYIASLTVDDGVLTSAADQVSIAAGIDLGTAGGGDPALLAHWKFDENTGSTAGDSAGSANGTIFGATWTGGVSGPALSFAGSDYVVTANDPALNVTGNAITLAAWINPSDGGLRAGSRMISRRTDAGGCDVYSMFTLGNKFRFRLDCQDLISSSSFSPNGWIHLAMVYDGTDKRIYVNGVLDQAVQAKTDTIDSSSRLVHLGMREAEGRNFTGQMDDVRIYNRALSAAEVVSLFDAATLPASQLATINSGTGGGTADATGGSTGGGSTGGGSTPPPATGGGGVSTSGNSLAALAGSLTAGQWGALQTNNINAVLGASGSSGTVFGYTDDLNWNPVTRQLQYLGGDHGDRATFVVYNESNNTWVDNGPPSWVTTNTSHGYDHMAIDPATGDFFSRKQNSATVRRWNGSQWSTLPPSIAGYTQSIALAIEYFPEMNGLIWAAIESGPLGEVVAWNRSTNSWRRIAGNLPMGPFHTVAEYNPVHKVVIFGGGNGSKALYSVDANDTVKTLAPAPYAVGIQSSILTVDPVSGDYLVFFRNGEFWVYDVVSDTWSKQNVSVPIFTSGFGNPVHGVAATPIGTYGVVLFATCKTGSNCRVTLYKHAPGGGSGGGSTPAPSATLSSAQSAIAAGQSSVLTWSSANATACTASDGWLGAKATSGSETVSPSQTTTYSLACAGAGGTVSTNATVTVTAPNQPPLPGGLVGGFAMPSLQDEKDTYLRWNWTWSASQEPNFAGDPNYGFTPDVHYDTEGDDLWTYLHMYRRTGEQGYLDRATWWANYFKNDFRLGCKGGSDFCFDRNNFGSDHMYGWGLVAWYEYSGDTAALTEAENLAAIAEATYNDPKYVPGARSMAYYSFRRSARHLILATYLAEATQNPRWIALRDKLIDLWVQSPDWDARGMYFSGRWQTDQVLSPGAYDSGDRIILTFQLGVLTEAFAQAYRVTGRADIRDRMVAMANFVDQYGMDPTVNYTGSVLGIVNGQPYHNYSGGTFWDPVYPTSLVNTLVWGYKFTGDTLLLDRAKFFFNRGTKGFYGSATRRTAGDNEVGHFVDTQFSSSSLNRYLANNRGELQYVYMIFENGGLPTVVTGP